MTFFVILRPELTIVNLVKGENKGYKWKPGQRVSLIADKHLVSGKYRPLPDVLCMDLKLRPIDPGFPNQRFLHYL